MTSSTYRAISIQKITKENNIQQLKEVLRKMFKGRRSCAVNVHIIHHRFPGSVAQ
jgi:hypothetical protein